MNNKENKESKEQIAKLTRFFKFYIAPIGSISIFIIIMLFFVIPKIGEIFAGLQQISDEVQTSRSLQDKLTILNNLSARSGLILSQLQVINETAPTGNTEVVNFRDKITELCNRNSLRVTSQRLSESNVTARPEDEGAPVNLRLQEIPFNFEITGGYDDILAFIVDLSAIDDFVIVREMQLTKAVNGQQVTETTLTLRIDKYQFSIEDQDALNIVYLNVPASAQINEKILEFIEAELN